MDVFDRLRRIGELELEYRLAMCKRESAENISAKFSADHDIGKKARERFRLFTDEVINLRKRLAQQVFKVYGTGVDDKGNIIWRDDNAV